jgi:hypothetical protein
MTSSDYENFDKALDELACSYCAKLDVGEIVAYFKQLSRFPTDLVVKVLEAAPESHPTYFPKAGELRVMCEAALVEDRTHLDNVDSVTAIRLMSGCDHELLFEPEPDGELFAGFESCTKCNFSKPVTRKDADERQVRYLAMAISNQPRRSHE